MVIEIVRHQLRQAGTGWLTSGARWAGFAAGLLLMYVTGLFVSV